MDNEQKKYVPLKVQQIDKNETYLQGLADVLNMVDEIAGSLSVIALYFERKGIQEALFTQEELDSQGEEGEDDEPEIK